jgi:hypothetical protein
VSEDLLNQMHEFDRVSIRAVLLADGENPDEALSSAGIFEPVTISVTVGAELDPSCGILGDGHTPNLTGVLETQYEHAPDDGFGSSFPEIQPDERSRQIYDAPPARSGTATLPPAFGLQPLAPVRRPRR